MLHHFLIFSLRLTAYVVKVFAMASNLVPIESSVICDAIRFLISQTQNSDGSFREIGRVYSSGMSVRCDSHLYKMHRIAMIFLLCILRIIFWHVQGDVQGKDADASMTAFCLIALQEARSTCHSTVSVSDLE